MIWGGLDMVLARVEFVLWMDSIYIGLQKNWILRGRSGRIDLDDLRLFVALFYCVLLNANDARDMIAISNSISSGVQGGVRPRVEKM